MTTAIFPDQAPSVVRLHRAALGWSQKRLSEEAGITRPCLGEFERGETTPHRSTIAAVARALGVSPEAITPQNDERRPAGAAVKEPVRHDRHDEE